MKKIRFCHQTFQIRKIVSWNSLTWQLASCLCKDRKSINCIWYLCLVICPNPDRWAGKTLMTLQKKKKKAPSMAPLHKCYDGNCSNEIRQQAASSPQYPLTLWSRAFGDMLASTTIANCVIVLCTSLSSATPWLETTGRRGSSGQKWSKRTVRKRQYICCIWLKGSLLW